MPLPSCTAHATPSCPEVSRFAAISTVRTVCTLLNKPVFSVVVICKSTEHTSNLWIQPLGSTSRNSSDMAPQIRVKKRNFGHGDLQDLPRQNDKQEQDRIKDRSPQLATTIQSRQGPSLDDREAGRSQPETTQILAANQTQRCRSKEQARPKDQHAKRPITYQGPRSLRYILHIIIAYFLILAGISST